MKNFLRTNAFPVVFRSCVLLYPILTGGMVQAATWYVKPGGTGTGTTNWANAAPSTQLATIIAGAVSGDQVWVVGSSSGVTYYPTTGASRTAAFTLKSGVLVYGGFAGTETLVTQRNYATNLTILSGDIGIVTNNTDNSYNVVVSSGNTGTTVLDGFTIENGNANGAGQYSTGGGIYNSGTTVTYANCIITANTAIGNGGGIYITGTGTVTYTNCIISFNSTSVAASASTGGGGGYATGATAIFTNSTFRHNTTSLSDGGGFYIYNSSSYQFTNCAFDTCTAAGSGGGLFNIACNGMTLTGSSFIGNFSNTTAADYGGGGLCAENIGSGLTITSCSFSGNTSSSYGGGALTYNTSGYTMGNCIFSQNSAAVYGGGLATYGGNTFNINNCKLSNNVAPSGGGIYVIGGSQTYSFDTIANNTATATSGMGGGGLCEDVSTSPTISHCWFSGNVTNGANGAGKYDNSAGNDSNTVYQANIAKGTASNGGGIYHASQTGKTYNDVLVNNSCTGYGGGLYNYLGNATYEHLTFYNNSSGNSTTGGDGVYVGNGTNPHITNEIIWSPVSGSVGLVIGSGTPKINNSVIQGQTQAFWNTYGTNNFNTAPAFGNSGNYTGADGMWATADDGLHQVAGSSGADIVPSGSYLLDDITDAVRPDAGSTAADAGAYEGGGTFATLAIQLINFTAIAASGNTADLSWQVDDAQQAAAYQVQRSAKGTDFSVIGTVNAVAGQITYAYTDENATVGVIYYRLQIIQPDGTGVFSPIVMVRNAPQTDKVSLRPSVAAQGSTTLYIGTSQAICFMLTIADASGRMLSRRSVTVSQSDNYVPLDVASFQRGVYYVRVVGNDGFRKVLTFEKL